MNKSGLWFTLVAVMLAVGLSVAYPNLAQACGGSGDGGNSHMGNMGNMGSMMGYGQGGNYYPTPPAPTPPPSVTPPSNPGSAYTKPDTRAGGQMMGQGDAVSDHKGHTGH
jgi:hypothetical protein